MCDCNFCLGIFFKRIDVTFAQIAMLLINNIGGELDISKRKARLSMPPLFFGKKYDTKTLFG